MPLARKVVRAHFDGLISKSLQKKEHRALGQIVSQLLSEALARRRTPRKMPAFKWTSRSMRAFVDLTDKEALYAILDENKT